MTEYGDYSEAIGRYFSALDRTYHWVHSVSLVNAVFDPPPFSTIDIDGAIPSTPSSETGSTCSLCSLHPCEKPCYEDDEPDYPHFYPNNVDAYESFDHRGHSAPLTHSNLSIYDYIYYNRPDSSHPFQRLGHMPRTPYGAEYQGPPQPSTTPAASAPYNKSDSKHVHWSQDLEYETLGTAPQFPSSFQGGQQFPGFNSGTWAKHFPGFSENIGGSSYTGNAEYQWPPQPSAATPASTPYPPPSFHLLVIDNSVHTSNVGSGNSYTSLIQDSYNDNSITTNSPTYAHQNSDKDYAEEQQYRFCGTCKRTFEPFNETEVDADDFDESPSNTYQFDYESRFTGPSTGTQRAPAAEYHHVNHLAAETSWDRYFQSETATKSYFAYSGNSGDIGGAYSPAAWYPPSYPVYYTTDGNLLGGQPIYLVPRDSDVKPNTGASASRKAKKGIKSLWKFLSSKI